MAGKETNRQKLVKLMYLVFLSLTALNVDVSVLDSFVRVDDGIRETNVNFARKVDMVYDDFRMQKAISEDLVYPYYDRAFYVKELSDSLVNAILRYRAETIATADGISVEEADTLNLLDLSNKDAYSTTTRYWMVEGKADELEPDGGRGTHAYILRNMIEDYTTEIKSQLDSAHLEYLQLGLGTEGPYYTEGGDEINWQQAMFNRIVPVAKATNLSRLVTEVRNAEFDVISILYDAITADDFSFDQIEARVVPTSEVVMVGDAYEADVFVAAYDTRQQPTVLVNGNEIETEDGIGKLRLPARTPGSRDYNGVIKVTSPAGIVQEYPFEGRYVVQQPSVTVSADAMNVFYAGVDNPVSVSAPGIPHENLNVSISRGTMTPRGGGRYAVNVPGDIDEVRITVTALIGDARRDMGSPTFRVRRIPDPIPTIAGQQEGTVDKQALAINPKIVASTPDDFDFDMDFEVATFSMQTTIAGLVWERTADGNRLTDEMLRTIQDLSRGSRVYFTGIRTHPAADGVTRRLAPISIRIR